MAFRIFNKKREGKEEKKEEEKHEQVALPVPGSLAHVLQKPHISEKAGHLAEKQEYVFVVAPAATKTQIKEAVESRYKVKVLRVRTSRVPAKKRKVGRRMGERQGFRKAIVKLAEGHTIEVLPR